MYRKLYVTLLLICSVPAFAQEKVTLASLLKEMTDPAAVASLPAQPFVLKQVSSYDRRSVAPDQPGWFANDDHTHFIRKDDKEYVMMDEDGPGVIVRFWETTFKRGGTLRIYFDHERQASIVIPAYDLMKFPYPVGNALLIPHSSYEPLQKGGSTLYLPMPFNKHCKITWEDADDPVKEPRYYQVNFRKYKPGTQVETFSRAVFESVRTLLDVTNDRLLEPAALPKGKSGVKGQMTGIVKVLDLPLPAGSNAIDNIELQSDNIKDLYIIAEFDGKETVHCPVSNFFGNGAIESWYRTVDTTGKMICRFIMPYKKNGKISIVHKGDAVTNVKISVSVRKWKWNERSLYFHADWRFAKDVPIRRTEADGPIEWDLANIKGNGVFVGETLSVNNHMHKWYGEGDQKLWVDGETFPSEYGTGLEDYYNTSWAPVVLYQSPFANATRADNADSFGENTFTRTRNSDIVPFSKNFRFSVEMLGWENGSADVGAVTYWYGRP